ncbi:unnamed protein product, partial [Rotaria sp. Silwood1]
MDNYQSLLTANAVATRNCTKVDYDVTTLVARQQTQKRTLATVVATTITSTASSLFSNRHSTGSEDSVNTSSQQSSLTAAATRLAPMPDHLRSFVAKKRGRISENEENDENNNDTSVLH